MTRQNMEAVALVMSLLLLAGLQAYGADNEELPAVEALFARSADAYAALVYTTQARPNPQVWAVSNAGDAGSTLRLNLTSHATIAAIQMLLQERFPQFGDVEIPARISNNVTLSTMHGCPPDEIERIEVWTGE